MYLSVLLNLVCFLDLYMLMKAPFMSSDKRLAKYEIYALIIASLFTGINVFVTETR
jgi:hypothetical protein